MKLMFLGAPGAGKGTQADIVSKRLKIPPVSTGAIIREAMANQTEMGMRAQEYMKDGALVPDEIVIGIIKERLSQPDCAGGFILDGFPRTMAQAVALSNMGIVVDYVISIEVPDSVIVERMAGRRVCSRCGATYHVSFSPPKNEKSCDACGGELSIRKDDESAVVLNRLAVYHEKTEPLKDYYRELGKYVELDGTREIEAVTAELLGLIGNL